MEGVTFETTFRRGDRVSVHAGPYAPRGAFVRGTFVRYNGDGSGADGVIVGANGYIRIGGTS